MPTSILETLILLVGILCLINWTVLLIKMRQIFASLPALAELPRRENEYSGPMLSIIVTACNEEDSLAKTVPLLLAQSYRPIELILINDRSSDKTNEIIEYYASLDPRITSIHIDLLPDGWLGKVNALQKGVEAASGDYYLFTDADIEFSPIAISSAIAFVENQHIDHLVVFPFNRGRRTFLLGMLSAAFGMLYCQLTKIRKVNSSEDNSVAGVGAFNLVRRSAFEKTPGFSWLRMEIIDDIGLGLMLKKAGFKTHVLNGLGSVEIDWYPNLWAMIKGLEKNLFPALGHYSYRKAFVRGLGMLASSAGPFAAFAYTGAWFLGIAILLLQVLAPGVLSLMSLVKTQQHALISFLIPLGYLILVFALARSTFFHWIRKGIRWRGTYYSTMDLQRGNRVRL